MDAAFEENACAELVDTEAGLGVKFATAEAEVAVDEISSVELVDEAVRAEVAKVDVNEDCTSNASS